MIQFISLVLFVCSSITALLAQSGETQTAPPCRIKELFKPNGWDIPGLSKVIVKTHGHYVSEGIPEGVFIDILESQAPEAFFTYVGLKSCETAQMSVRSVDVIEIERFTMNGHIFGYLVTGVIAAFDKQGHRIHFGSEERAYYYDPDGSGKFTVMRYDNGELIFKIIVPDWAKQSAKADH